MPVIKRNDFKTFATAKNANVLTNASYQASPYIGPGVKEGKASAALYNKTLRQSSIISVALANYLQSRLDEELIDDGTTETIEAQIKRAIGVQAQEDVVIPIGTLTKKGIVQFSETLSESESTDKNDLAATIGALSKIHRRLSLLESIINNTYVPKPGGPAYNPIYDWIIPVGTLLVYNNSTDPNKKYPGTKWAKLPSGVGLRTPKVDNTDLAQVGGSDSVTLDKNQLPVFKLGVNINTTSFDYGSKTSNPTDLGSPTTSPYDHGVITSSTFNYGTKTVSTHNIGNVDTTDFDYGSKGSSGAGGHSHTVGVARGGDGGNGSDPEPYACMWGSTTTSSVGDHTHTITIGSHKHTVSIGSHNHSVDIGSHNHTVTIGAHNHTVTLGSHTHVTPIGAHNHLVSGFTSEIGAGFPIDIINKYYGANIWVRTL